MQFVQSANDFPIVITLGDVMPTWGLTRWASNSGLRFVPNDTEGFTISGNGQQRLYKGLRRSHRFYNSNDTTLNYHCILEKKPASNVISFLMEGSEYFNFFYQPDEVKDPELKRSYAVYKKEIALGEGTGKLCHIKRPYIFDQMDQFTFGELSVAGNEFRITVSQQFLNTARYPVTVYIVVLASPLGAHWGYYEEDYEEPYFDEYGGWEEPNNTYYPLYCDEGLALNRYKIPQDLYGKVTAYVYLFRHFTQGWGYYNNNNSNIKPCLYSDNNNMPLQRISCNETFFDHEINTTNKKEGWRSTSFYTNSVLNAGSFVWFGMYSAEFQPRFDFGKKLYSCYDDDFDSGAPPPDICPVWNDWVEHDYLGNLDIILSMYFNYVPMQHYERTVTQGVKITDNRKLTAAYSKKINQSVNGMSGIGGYNTFVRQCVSNVTNSVIVNKSVGIFRTIIQHIDVFSVFLNVRDIINTIIETVQTVDFLQRVQGLWRDVRDTAAAGDTVRYPVVFVRSISETQSISDIFYKWGDYFRGLADSADNTAETDHRGEFYRTEKETVQAEGQALRGLIFFVRIFTHVFIRDYLLGRFLIAREELKLKSCITREITLDSRID